MRQVWFDWLSARCSRAVAVTAGYSHVKPSRPGAPGGETNKRGGKYLHVPVRLETKGGPLDVWKFDQKPLVGGC